ncbi:MAG: polysaccharide biosynthesis/export family protein [Xanthobacteraceae bacterium]
MRARRPFVFLLIAIAVAGCDHGAPVLSGPPNMADFFARSAPPTPIDEVVATRLARPAAAAVVVGAASPGLDVPYTLDSGDRLRITVFGQEGLTNTYTVDASGKVMLPLIGSVSARGLTDRQLSTAVADRLRQGFIREPHVAVEIEFYRPFFILGEVAVPGQYPYVPNMTVETAVAIAGGFTPRASHESVQLGRTIDGQPFRGRAPLATPVRPGDTITVEERWF